ncbi:MAG: pyridoxamine kinase [Eubacteriales bacterium]|nr:pyridoxamine kinase [Eubacteriales bacterium]
MKSHKLAVINDLSGYGRCSLAVAIPVISALGVQACAVPTSILSNHTGFPKEYKFDFTDHMSPYMDAWQELGLEFDGIVTGYMNDPAQVDAAAAFIEAFRSSETTVFVDPAMADHGKLYRGFTPAYAEYIKDKLIRHATVIKPNITEACILSGYDYDEVMSTVGDHTMRRLKSHLINIVEKLRELGPSDIVITGVDRGERILNTLADENGVKFISVKKTGANRPGTGDIFSSIVAASLIQGLGLEHAVRKACEFIAASISVSEEAGIPVNEGVMFEKVLSKLCCTFDQIDSVKKRN